MQKLLIYGLLILSPLTGLQGTTLLQLSLNDMIQQSTMIVRGKPQLSYTAARGAAIYTHYQVQVTATYKGTPTQQLDIAIPGGVSNGLRQSFAGAPGLSNRQDCVLFLWTSKTGLTQLIGLSQGLFRVVANSSGQLLVTRAASTEMMLNGNGQPVTDSDFQMLLSDLQSRIQSVLNGGSK